MFALFVPALVGALAAAMASLVGRVIIALGIGFVTYKGISVMLDAMRAQVVSSVSGMSADAVQFAAYLWVDKALTIVFSAITISLSFRLIGGGLKKMVVK
jgi:hypothetical protein